MTNPPFRNPYTQAFLMYPRRWLFRLVALWTLACISVPLVLAFFQYYYWHTRDRGPTHFTPRHIELNGPDEIAIFTMILATILLPAATSIASHARDQTTDWRGSLLPHARRPHLLLASLVLTLLTLLVTASFSLVDAPWSIPAFFSFTVILTAIGAACATLPPKGIAAAGIGSITLFSFHNVRLWLAYGLFGESPSVSYTLLLLSLLIFASLFTYLSLTRTERTPATPSDLVLGQGTPWHRRHKESLPTMPLRRRIQLWRLPSSTGLMPLALAAALLLLILTLVWTQTGERRLYVSISFPLAASSIIIPGAAVASQWTRRLPSLGYELSRPTTRPQFFRDLTLSMAIDWLSWWSYLTLAGLIGCICALYSFEFYITAPTSLFNYFFQGFFLAILLSAAVQSLLFGLTALTLSFQTPWLIYLILLPAVLSSWYPAIYISSHHTQWGPTFTTGITLCFPLTGLLLLYEARHRWLRLDLR